MKTLWFCLAGILLVLSATCQPLWADGWWSSSTQNAQTKKPASQPTQPTALDKLGTGMKNFANKTGEALSLKKPAPKKTTLNPYQSSRLKTSSSKPQQQSSWFGSLFKREEPKKPRTPSEWLELKRLDP